MLKKYWIMCFCLALTACVDFDESTYVTDDAGFVHHTIHYSKDKRGRKVFPLTIQATGERRFVFDPRHSAWAAYDEDGNRVLTGGASGGIDKCEENSTASCRTVTGSFRLYQKKGADCLSGEYPVSTKGGAKMPYCMYFYRGYTIHAAYEVPERASSHGCVRVFPSAAKWLNEEFLRLRAKVIVLPYADDNMKMI